MRTMRYLMAAAGLALAASSLASCSSKNSTNAELKVAENEFSVDASRATAVAGRVRVTVRNDGKVVHELVAFRTDLDEGSLPLTSQGDRIDEQATGVTHIDPEAEDIGPGKSKTITMELPAGRYVFVCNLAGHYGQGMHTVITTK